MKRLFIPLLVVAMLLSVFIGCTPQQESTLPSLTSPDATTSSEQTQQNQVVTDEPINESADELVSGKNMKVHVIDVGQGHSVLVESNGEFMLVDTGEAEYASTVLSYLNAQSVKKLKYAIATHPHSDHMGGFDEIIKKYTIDTFMMPNAQNDTYAFERMLTALNEENTPVKIPDVGQVYELGSVSFTILSPSSSTYEDLNDYSIGIRLECGNTSFIMTGDATSLAEAEMIESGLELDSDVMLVPHHASTSSSSSKFIRAISPAAAIISCGKDNDYGHPHDKIVTRYNSLGVILYRTDKLGSIVVEFDEDNYNVLTPNASTTISSTTTTTTTTVPSDVQYIGNKNSKKFHSVDCASLPAEHNRVYFDSRENAVAGGYSPCGSCNP